MPERPAPNGFAYPEDVARLMRERWDGTPAADDATLLAFVEGCYQASMFREEERPVTFRAILAEPALFDPEGLPPESLQRLEFAEHLPFGPGQLRRLSVAADPQRTLIGVRHEPGEGLRVWGLVNSGIRWLADVHGGRRAGATMPAVPIVRVDAPGSLEVYHGDELVGTLFGGHLSGSRLDVFESRWLPEMFLPFRDELVARHAAARHQACDLRDESWARIDTDLPRRVTERVHKRIIAMLRAARHGGTLLFIPTGQPIDGAAGEPYVDYRYRFDDQATRRCLPELIVTILNRLARIFGASGTPGDAPIAWSDFETTTDDRIETLDEALFEMAHLFAGLAEVDGAVVFNTHHELLGFGGMISGRLPEIRSVCRALDLEGIELAEARIASVGARHRAAYRLVGALDGSVAIVISQDGGVRFVTRRDGRVVYWEQD